MPKSRHNPRPAPWSESKPAVLTEEYEREVELSTHRLERRYEQAQKRAERAERRLEEAQRDRRGPKRRNLIARLQAEVELRREELEEYRRMMQASPASAEHRGVRSYRPVGVADSSL